jgi:uncharacterized protein (DUF1810 family)
MTHSHSDLQHFVDAQNQVLDQAVAELEAGSKESHWMWFVFPQIDGLGSSPMARRFAISGLDQAKRYLAHDILGRRLRSQVRLVLKHPDKTARQIFGTPDDLKFRSCLTLFRAAAIDPSPDWQLFSAALNRFYDGKPDTGTLDILAKLGCNPPT